MSSTARSIAATVCLLVWFTGCRSRSEHARPFDPKVTPTVAQRLDLADGLFLRQIGQGAFVITHEFPWGANALWVEMKDGSLVLAGSTCTPEALETVLGWAKNYFGQRPVVAINTGYHVDNLGGNTAALAASIPTYGSDLTVKLLQERGERSRQWTLQAIGSAQPKFYAAHASMKWVAPDHVFAISQGLTLRFGDEEVRVIYPGASQAPDKVAVYFPSRRLLFGSCMVLGWNGVGNTSEADLAAWPLAVKRLQQLPVDVVVPGHGDRLDPGLLEHTLQMLTAHQSSH